MYKLVVVIKREINPFVHPEGHRRRDYIIVMGFPAIVVVGILLMAVLSTPN